MDQTSAPWSPEEVETVDAAAKRLGIPKRTLYFYCANGTWPCVRLGRHIRIRISDVDYFLRTGHVDPSTSRW